MMFGLRILITLSYLLHVIHQMFLRLIHRRKLSGIPPVENPLVRCTATTLARKIREGEVSSQAVVEAFIERIKEVNPLLNAVMEDRFEDAIIDAKMCDAKLKSGEVDPRKLEKEKPLYGIPVTIKESCSLKGLSYTSGALLRKGMKATTDGFAVSAVKHAGAIPLCVTSLPEMCTSLQSFNFLYGHTSNPYDRRRSSGGSSSGEGALIGSGSSVIGIGSDIAGSIRIPAHHNGIFGHKPTAGVVSTEGHLPNSESEEFTQYLVVGPLARHAEDLHLAMKVLGWKFEDKLRLDEPVHLKDLRVHYIVDIDPMSSVLDVKCSEIRDCINDVVNYLREVTPGAQKLSEEWLTNSFTRETICFFDIYNPPNLYEDPKNPSAVVRPMWEIFKGLFHLSNHTVSNSVVACLLYNHGFVSLNTRRKWRESTNEMKQKFIELLKDDGIIIMPTWTETAPMKGIGFAQWYASVYCVFSNVFGFPATHVPIRLTKNGLPTGIQVVAGPYQDRLCLAVAKELEKKFGGWIPPSTS